MFKNTILTQDAEPIEVTALFGFNMTPCQPLSFKRSDGSEYEVDELLRTSAKFKDASVIHIFDVFASGRNFRLLFDATNLSWGIELV